MVGGEDRVLPGGRAAAEGAAVEESGAQGTSKRGEARLALSVIVIAYEEADRIGRALRSVQWADEVVVVDAGSRDGTPEVARTHGAEVFHRSWSGFVEQKRFAVEKTRHEWIFWLDADEEVSPELARGIRRALTSESERFAAFAVRRKTWYLGRFVRFGGWYPDWKVRLFRKDRATFTDVEVHEELVVDGPVGRIDGDLFHFSYRNISHHAEKIRTMAALWARQNMGRRVSWLHLVFHPFSHFLRSYILRLGFLEGWRGLVIAAMGAYYVFLKYVMLKEGNHTEGRP